MTSYPVVGGQLPVVVLRGNAFVGGALATLLVCMLQCLGAGTLLVSDVR